jgi:hypothetical protein
MHPGVFFRFLLLLTFRLLELVFDGRREEFVVECFFCRPSSSWIKLQESFKEVDCLFFSCVKWSLVSFPAAGPGDDFLESEASVTNRFNIGLEDATMHGCDGLHSALAEDRSDLDHSVNIVRTVEEWKATCEQSEQDDTS